MSNYTQGQKVKWKWSGEYVHGTVKTRYEERVERRIKGKDIVRNGSTANPAYYIETDQGNHVLKLSTELENA